MSLLLAILLAHLLLCLLACSLACLLACFLYVFTFALVYRLSWLACCAGSLRELALTGLPRLRHLEISQRMTRLTYNDIVRCKALRLPSSLEHFDLTVSTESLSIEEELSVLARLPELKAVGLHVPMLQQIPALPPTVTRCNFAFLWHT